MYGKPVGPDQCCFAGGADWRSGCSHHVSLARVLGYVGAVIVERACVRISVGREAVGTEGLIGDPATRGRIADVVQTLVRHLSATVETN